MIKIKNFKIQFKKNDIIFKKNDIIRVSHIYKKNKYAYDFENFDEVTRYIEFRKKDPVGEWIFE